MPGEQASPRGTSPVTVPVEVEAELRAAAGQAVAAAAASSRPPLGSTAFAEDERAAERRRREERQAALAAQKRVRDYLAIITGLFSRFRSIFLISKREGSCAVGWTQVYMTSP